MPIAARASGLDALYASRYFRAAQPENSHRRRYGAGRLPIGSLFWLFPIQHFRRLMIRRLSVPVLLECEPDKSERHKDGSGQHHPMGVFPIEQQGEHFGHCPPSARIAVG